MSPRGGADSGPAGVTARGWGYRHAGRRAFAVRGLDLDVAPGERVLLLGPSGAGKSTLLAALAGLLTAQESGEVEGSLLVGGSSAGPARARVGLVLQDPDSQLVMSRAGDDVAFGPENHGVPRGQIWLQVDEALALVGFPYGRDRPTATLSGGEKQRLALAGVLALRPGLLLLDEPTANLDPDGARLVRDAVARAVAATGATLIVVEHRVPLWTDVVDRVIVLGTDGLLGDGRPAEVFAASATSLAAAGVWLPGLRPTVTRRPFVREPLAGASVSGASRGDAPGAVMLSADGVSARYPSALADAVAPTDIALAAGTTTAVIGANGSGKSTLLTLLAGLARPRTGAVTVAGNTRPLHRLRARDLARRVGTVFQEPEHQFVSRTARGELLVAPRVLGWTAHDAEARADLLLERLGLSALGAANPFTLSGGQKRRLSVATALSAAPDVLLLDEPTFGQDAVTWAVLVDLLDEVRAAGTAVGVVSHDEAFVATAADVLATMAAGRLAAPTPSARDVGGTAPDGTGMPSPSRGPGTPSPGRATGTPSPSPETSTGSPSRGTGIGQRGQSAPGPGVAGAR